MGVDHYRQKVLDHTDDRDKGQPLQRKGTDEQETDTGRLPRSTEGIRSIPLPHEENQHGRGMHQTKDQKPHQPGRRKEHPDALRLREVAEDARQVLKEPSDTWSSEEN